MRNPYNKSFEMAQSGRLEYELFALLLLRLPPELMYQALFALPRFADRKRKFTALIAYARYVTATVVRNVIHLTPSTLEAMRGHSL